MSGRAAARDGAVVPDAGADSGVDEAALAKRLRRWAQTEISAPVPWGEVEQQLLAEPRPPADELERMFPRARPVQYLGLLFLLPQLVLVGGAVVGLGLVVADVALDAGLPSGWGFLVPALFWAGVVSACSPLLTWWESKRRRGGPTTAPSCRA